MDISAAKQAIQEITSLPHIWALTETIDRITSWTNHNECIPDEINPDFYNLVEIGALLSCQRKSLESGYFARSGVMPYQTAAYATMKMICDEQSMWYGFDQNMTIGAEAALYDEEGNEDITDMLPLAAVNSMYI